jgi:hypothetical protein
MASTIEFDINKIIRTTVLPNDKPIRKKLLNKLDIVFPKWERIAFPLWGWSWANEEFRIDPVHKDTMLPLVEYGHSHANVHCHTPPTSTRC